MNIDPTIVAFLGWVLSFLFLSLISIIVWLAKTVLKKIETIVKYQEEDSVERAVIRRDIDAIKLAIDSINGELKDIPYIKQKLVKVEVNEKHITGELTGFKTQIQNIELLIKELQFQINEHDKLLNKLS